MSKYRILIVFSIAACFWSCKNSSGPNGDGNNGGTTPASVGDSIPTRNSFYIYDFDLLDTHDEIIPGTTSSNHSAFVDSTGLSFSGKTNVYRIIDDASDTAYFAYESNGDVSVYFLNPGYTQVYYDPKNKVNEPLQQVDKKVFNQWITLPIASKAKGKVIYDAIDVPITIGIGERAANIHATVDYLSDSTIVLSGKQYTTKICRISLFAPLKTKVQGNFIDTVNHTRTLWFVPKLGYFAKLHIRTDMQEYTVDLIPRDTTAILKVLTSITH